MKLDPTDVSFVFPYAQGHFGCICSRCLSRITKQETAFRMLKPNSLLAFEEFRFCQACQTQAGCIPEQSNDALLAKLTREMREHPRFRATQKEMDTLIRSLRMTRAGLARAKANAEAEAKERSQRSDPWEDPGFLMPLAVALKKTCSTSVGTPTPANNK
jgi:hypothetical protein